MPPAALSAGPESLFLGKNRFSGLSKKTFSRASPLGELISLNANNRNSIQAIAVVFLKVILINYMRSLLKSFGILKPFFKRV
ncbi:hypothetical protein D0S45_16150 [Marinifilum sp. JC120]|nr:hypothetical protein D0S45_16150 [Marinifilum sp. JC120]